MELELEKLISNYYENNTNRSGVFDTGDKIKKQEFIKTVLNNKIDIEMFDSMLIFSGTMLGASVVKIFGKGKDLPK